MIDNLIICNLSSISIPPENIRKPDVFQCFEACRNGTMVYNGYSRISRGIYLAVIRVNLL